MSCRLRLRAPPPPVELSKVVRCFFFPLRLDTGCGACLLDFPPFHRAPQISAAVSGASDDISRPQRAQYGIKPATCFGTAYGKERLKWSLRIAARVVDLWVSKDRDVAVKEGVLRSLDQREYDSVGHQPQAMCRGEAMGHVVWCGVVWCDHARHAVAANSTQDARASFVAPA